MVLRALSEGLGREVGQGKLWRLKMKQPQETAELQGAMGARVRKPGSSYLCSPASARYSGRAKGS